MKWIILTSAGNRPEEFDTEEECEAKCAELREINKHVNICYIPHKKED